MQTLEQYLQNKTAARQQARRHGAAEPAAATTSARSKTSLAAQRPGRDMQLIVAARRHRGRRPEADRDPVRRDSDQRRRRRALHESHARAARGLPAVTLDRARRRVDGPRTARANRERESRLGARPARRTAAPPAPARHGIAARATRRRSRRRRGHRQRRRQGRRSRRHRHLDGGCRQRSRGAPGRRRRRHRREAHLAAVERSSRSSAPPTTSPRCASRWTANRSSACRSSSTRSRRPRCKAHRRESTSSRSRVAAVGALRAPNPSAGDDA